MENGTHVASRDVAVVPERRPQLDRTRRGQPQDARMCEINQALRRDRAGDRHKEEEGERGSVPEQQHDSQRAAADCGSGGEAGRHCTAVPAHRRRASNHERRGRQHDGKPASRRDGEGCRGMGQRGCQSSAVAATSHDFRGAEDRSQGAGLQRCRDRIEGMD